MRRKCRNYINNYIYATNKVNNGMAKNNLIEKTYLREELQIRLSIIYNLPHQTIVFVITVWSAIITLFSAVHKSGYIEHTLLFSLLLFVFLLTSFYIYYASQRYLENLDQLNNIAMYYACFYNKPIDKDFSFEESETWEFSLFEVERRACNKSGNKRNEKKMNGEFGCFSVFSILLSFASSLYAIYLFVSENINPIIVMFFITYSVIVIVIEIFLTITVFKNMSLKSFENKRAKTISKWIEFAKDKGYFSDKQAKKLYANLRISDISVEKR